MRKLIVLMLLSIFTSVLFARPEAAVQSDDGTQTVATHMGGERVLLADASLRINTEAPLPTEIDAPQETVVEAPKDLWAIVLDIVSNNWELILSGLAYILYRFIPTKKADIIISLISWLWNTLLPDRKKGGGTHSI